MPASPDAFAAVYKTQRSYTLLSGSKLSKEKEEKRRGGNEFTTPTNIEPMTTL
jgi:hypothetical protein